MSAERCPVVHVVAPPLMKRGQVVRCTCGTPVKITLRPYSGQPLFTIEAHNKPSG